MLKTLLTVPLRLALPVLLMLPGLSAQAAPACFSEAQRAPLLFRAMQQDFSVASLYCPGLDPQSGVQADYERFVLLFSDRLKSNAREIRHIFASRGKSMDRWLTATANQASIRVTQDADFCRTAAAELRQALGMTEAGLDALAAAPAARQAAVPLCGKR